MSVRIYLTAFIIFYRDFKYLTELPFPKNGKMLSMSIKDENIKN